MLQSFRIFPWSQALADALAMSAAQDDTAALFCSACEDGLCDSATAPGSALGLLVCTAVLVKKGCVRTPLRQALH